MTLVCITNDMTDIRSCTTKDAHLVSCNGWAYRWNDTRGREEATGKECRGCVPREARRGLLCWTCWESAEEALGGHELLRQRLAGVDRAVQRDNAGVRSQTIGYVPIPSVKLMFDELDSYLRSMTSSAELWVANKQGAVDAVRFGRAYAAGVRSHPTEEKAHRIDRARCTECRQMCLVWNPVARFGDEVRITCGNPECSLSIGQTSFELLDAQTA